LSWRALSRKPAIDVGASGRNTRPDIDKITSFIGNSNKKSHCEISVGWLGNGSQSASRGRKLYCVQNEFTIQPIFRFPAA